MFEWNTFRTDPGFYLCRKRKPVEFWALKAFVHSAVAVYVLNCCTLWGGQAQQNDNPFRSKLPVDRTKQTVESSFSRQHLTTSDGTGSTTHVPTMAAEL